MEEEQFQNAPQFDNDSWPDMMDRHWVDAIHVYYGKPYRWGNTWGRTMHQSRKGHGRSCGRPRSSKAP